MRRVRRLDIIDRINKKLSKVLMYLTLILTIVIMYGVLVRYLAGRADAKIIFISVWLYGSMFVLGGGYTLLEKGHVSVDIVYKRLSPRVRQILDALNLLLITLCCIVIIYVSAPLAYKSFIENEVDSSLGIVFAPPIWWFKWIAVIGVVLFALQALSILYRVIRNSPTSIPNGGDR